MTTDGARARSRAARLGRGSLIGVVLALVAAACLPTSIKMMKFTRYVIDPNPSGAVVEKALGDLTGGGHLDAIVGEESSPSQPMGGGIF